MDIGHRPTLALSRADHLQINYWAREDWTLRKASVQQAGITTSGDEIGALDFIESVDGIPVSPERIVAIRRSSRELFFSLQMMYARNKRRVPVSWGLMSHGDKGFYREKIKEQYPELALCEADWKFEYVATHTYPGWYRNHGKPKVKQEPGTKQRSKTTAGSPTPAPDDASGYIPPTSTTPDSGTSPTTPVLDLGLDPLDPGSPTAQGVDCHEVLEPSQDPNPTQNPVFSFKSPSPQSIGLVSSTTSPGPAPPVPTNVPFGTDDRSLGVPPPPDAEVAAPTIIEPLQHEITPSVPIQVRRLFLSSTALRKQLALVSRLGIHCASPHYSRAVPTLTSIK